MVKYIIKRLLYVILVFFILSFLLFLIYNMLPIDKAKEMTLTEKKQLTGSQKENYNEEERYEYWQKKYGLNGSKIERYLRWMGLYPYTDPDTNKKEFKGLLQGDLGQSLKNEPVIEVITPPMGNTIFINIFATVFGLGITIPLGIFCAVKRGSKRDTAVQVGTIIGYSIPTFIIAIVFIWLFSKAGIIPLFPVSGSQSSITVGMTKSQLFWDKMYHLASPLIVMTFCSLGGMTRYVRASMIEALSMDCIRTARAKGLREKVVIYSHAWRNALIPIVTLVVGWFLGIFAGSMMIEHIFSLNGIGEFYYKALNSNDNAVVLGLQMFYIAISLLGNLLIDIIYGFVDPRIRVNK